MNVSRLIALRSLLLSIQTTQPGSFNLSSWADLVDYEEPACGTTACACGWAGVTPEFVAQGFTLSYPGPDGDVHVTTLAALTQVTAAGELVRPTFAGLHDFEAVEVFFQLEVEEAQWLFSQLSYRDTCGPTAGDVAARIDKLLLTTTMAEAAELVRTFA